METKTIKIKTEVEFTVNTQLLQNNKLSWSQAVEAIEKLSSLLPEGVEITDWDNIFYMEDDVRSELRDEDVELVE